MVYHYAEVHQAFVALYVHVLHTLCPKFCLSHMSTQYTVTQSDQHRFYLFNVDIKFKDTEYEQRIPQSPPVFLLTK